MSVKKSNNKLTRSQIILLALMSLTAVSIIGFGIFIVVRTVPPPIINPSSTASPDDKNTLTPNAPEIIKFSLSPDGQIVQGECVQLKLKTNGEIDTLIIRRASTVLFSGAPTSENMEDCPPQPGNWRYEITITGPGGSASSQEDLHVKQHPTPTQSLIEIIDFSVSPKEIHPSECVQISWTLEGIPDTFQLLRNDQTILDSQPPEASYRDCPADTGMQIYFIQTSRGDNNINTPKISVQVIQPTPIPPESILGVWKLSFYAGEQTGYMAVLPATIISATFSTEGDLNGSTGCNTFHSSYTDLDNNLVIAPIAATKKYCTSPPEIMQQEDAFLSVFAEAAAFQVQNNILEIYNADGKIILVFIR